MKTMERKLFALIGAMACCFCFGLAEHQAYAIIPTCQRSCCEPLYAWYTGIDVFCAQVAGTIDPTLPGTNTTTALASVFLPAITPGSCTLRNAGTYDSFQWTHAFYTCEDTAGNTPTPQQVNPYGVPPTVVQRGRTRQICAPIQ